MPKVELSHLDKVFFPQAKITKGDLIEYYRDVSKYILPYLKDRPHSLLRQPDGIGGETFFQKDIDEPPAWLKTIKIRAESTGEDVHYLVVKDLDHLLYMVQLGSIEINPWNSRVGHLDKPDWAAIDLDPEGVGFDKVVEAARAVKQVCDELDIQAYPKTSGKSGMHIYIPAGAKYKYDECRQFAEALAKVVHERTADFTSLERAPEKRRGKVYIDFLQNSEGQTLAAPYSVRPTPQATVSAPLHWDEVKKGLAPKQFTIENIRTRLKRIGDLWKPVLGKGADIQRAIKLLN